MTITALNSNTFALKLVPIVIDLETHEKKAVSRPILKAFFIPVRFILRILDKVFPISKGFVKFFYNLEIQLLSVLDKYVKVIYQLSIEECHRDYNWFVDILEIYERILVEMRDELESATGSHFELKHYDLLKQIVENMRSIEATLDILSMPEMREALFKRLNAA